MDALVLPEIELSRRWVWRPDKKLQGKGEKEVQDALGELGLAHWYEPWEYELKVDEFGVVRGVCFDFWLPQSADWPEINIEVTDTKHPGKKIRKIRAVEEMYGIPTLLVTWPLARVVRRHPERLAKRIEAMLQDSAPLALVS